jgi:hypothetical protein
MNSSVVQKKFIRFAINGLLGDFFCVVLDKKYSSRKK